MLADALMLCVALQLSHGWHQDPSTAGSSPASSASQLIPQSAPCLLHDILGAMREGLENGELTNSSVTLFGVCPSGSVLVELARKASTHQERSLGVLHPTRVLAEEESGVLSMVFDLPPSPLLKLDPVLLLMFERPIADDDSDVGLITFVSQSLQPHAQAACVSGGTHYVLLTGKASESNTPQTWRVSVETNPDMKKRLKELLIGGTQRNNILTSLLLFPEGTGTETRNTNPPGSSENLSFLCELRRFLCDVLPQNQPESPPLNLDSLQSLPLLTLSSSSSDATLAALINSSAPTVFSFTSSGLPLHRGELALSSPLLEEVRQKLDQSVMKVAEALTEEEEGRRHVARLTRLVDLSAIPNVEQGSGERQYRAFLLLKALKTAGREMQRNLRATRAEPSQLVRNAVCSLRSLTVSLQRHLTAPTTASINNCHGSCAFPLVNTNSHAVLLNSHIENGHVGERAPCCVPVAYEALEVVTVNEHGTEISTKADMVAKECGCR